MTSIGAKANHVREKIREGRTRGHKCHWPGCERECTPAQWGCRQHWFRLPQRLRNKIWRAYRPGQEDDKGPYREYVEVAREVRDWITANNPIGG